MRRQTPTEETKKNLQHNLYQPKKCSAHIASSPRNYTCLLARENHSLSLRDLVTTALFATDFSRWLSGRPWIPEPASAGLFDCQEARLKPAANPVAELRNTN